MRTASASCVDEQFAIDVGRDLRSSGRASSTSRARPSTLAVSTRDDSSVSR